MAVNHTTPSPPSVTRGRGLIATRAIRPGDIIAIFDDPSRDIAIPDSYHLATSCSYCLHIITGNELIDNYNTTLKSSAAKLKACTGCRAVYYCGATCQKKDWTRVHKQECKVFQRLKGSEFATGHNALPTGVRALVQVLLRDEVRSAAEGLESHMEDFRSAGQDESSPKSMSSGGKQEDITSWKDMQLQAMAALHYLGREGNEKETMEAMEILCKLQVNSFNRLDTDIGQTGQFLNTQLAMLNHSCVPNSYVQFSGRSASLRAYQAIKEGEEIEISYIDNNLHLSARQASLKARYHFVCVCPRCSQNLDIYQACKLYPHHDLNKPFALLAPSDIPSLLQNPPQTSQPLSQNPSLLTLLSQEIYPRCTTPVPPQISSNPSLYRTLLRERWSLTSPLRKLNLYAIEPVPQILTETAIFLVESRSRSNSSDSDHEYYSSSLSLWLFLAMTIEPYRNPLPCAPWRVKVLLMIVRVLGNAAASASESEGSSAGTMVSKTGVKRRGTVEAKIARVVADMDIVTTSQVLLLLILHSSHHLSSPSSSSSPASTSRQNPPFPNFPPQPSYILSEAKTILEEIHTLPGREAEAKLVANFFRRPEGVEEKLFFEMIILKPLREIAGFAMEVMDSI